MKKFLTLALTLFSTTALTTASFAGKADLYGPTTAPAPVTDPAVVDPNADPSMDGTDSTDDINTPSSATFSAQQAAGIGVGAGLGGLLLGAGGMYAANRTLSKAEHKINSSAIHNKISSEVDRLDDEQRANKEVKDIIAKGREMATASTHSAKTKALAELNVMPEGTAVGLKNALITANTSHIDTKIEKSHLIRPSTHPEVKAHEAREAIKL